MALCPAGRTATLAFSIATALSVPTAQPPQRTAIVLVGPVFRPGCQSGGDLHTSREFLAPYLARGRFLITLRRFARGATTHRYRGDHALEHNRPSGEGYAIARLETARGLHALAVHVNRAAADRIGGRRP